MYYLTKTQRNPWSLLDDFDSFLGAPRGLSLLNREATLEDFTPRVDVSETDKKIKISAELPGVDEKDVTVELDNNVITIRGDKKNEKEEEGENWYRKEQTYGSFQRVFTLPEGINAEKVKARFDKGRLSIVIPKVKEVQAQPKQIAIES